MSDLLPVLGETDGLFFRDWAAFLDSGTHYALSWNVVRDPSGAYQAHDPRRLYSSEVIFEGFLERGLFAAREVSKGPFGTYLYVTVTELGRAALTVWMTTWLSRAEGSVAF